MSCLFAIIEKKAAKRRLEGEWYDRIKEKGSTKEQDRAGMGGCDRSKRLQLAQ